ncbi:hypothetical protein BH09BAC3_BH09BAC3_05510 [soil metagenome]
MVLTNKKEKFKISSGKLIGDQGTVIDSFDEIIYCEPQLNYSESFGFQWQKFQTTQIDHFQNGVNQSQERFFAVTKWDRENLTNQNILEVGSGAGRFSSIVLQKTNADLFSVDYSHAVDTNFKNNAPHPRFRLFQASVYDLPFELGQFDKVFCFGVLQHTPDIKRSVECLAMMVKPEGMLIVDFYQKKGLFTKLHVKYLLRPITKRWSHSELLNRIDRNADRLIKAYRFLTRIGLGVLTRFLPIVDIDGTLPKNLTPQQLREWVVLDTFDMFSPQYDQPQKLETVANWFREFGLKEVTAEIITYGGFNKVATVKGIR